MSDTITIRLSFGRKSKIDLDTFRAIKRAIPMYDDDRRVIAYACAHHEAVQPELVAHIRRAMIIRGELPKRAYSRRHEAGCGNAGL